MHITQFKLYQPFVMVIFLSFFFHLADAKPRINQIHLTATPLKTRIIFDLSEALKYEIYQLTQPRRMMLEIYKLKSPYKLTIAKKKYSVVDDFRHKNVAYGSRVIFDLNTQVKIKSFQVSSQNKKKFRIIVDLIKIIKKKKSLKIAQKKLRQVVVAIDPGHGGKDPGAIGYKKLKEKTVVLKIAKYIHAILSQHQYIKVEMIRDSDQYIALNERIHLARKAKADLFVSIHADSAPNRSASGSSVYILSNKGASSLLGKWLENKANTSPLASGVTFLNRENDVVEMLLQMSMEGKKRQSKLLAENILAELKTVSKLHQNTVQSAGFLVLKSPDIPAILVETGFISNDKDRKNLNSKNYQKKIAAVISRGIIAYLKKYAPPTTLFNQGKLNVLTSEINR